MSTPNDKNSTSSPNTNKYLTGEYEAFAAAQTERKHDPQWDVVRECVAKTTSHDTDGATTGSKDEPKTSQMEDAEGGMFGGKCSIPKEEKSGTAKQDEKKSKEKVKSGGV
jgi:hypothetical protein